MFDPEKIKIEVRGNTLPYVSRGGLKLEKALQVFPIDLQGKTCLDIGASTGGFTDCMLQNGAEKVFAVDVGTDQLHPSLRSDPRIELHEKTDIRDFTPGESIDVVVIDVSFISLRDILPHVARIVPSGAKIVAMLKPQFEAGRGRTNKGVIKNNAVRRRILADFELWAERYFVIVAKRDSEVAGQKGNVERFYLLRLKKS
jgi:23S rRNA (cytidine1920-2'-O)/16S rRNA (cytidine1409-2'-O)-methyltransferase